MRLFYISMMLACLSAQASSAGEMAFDFKNPSFSGDGYSSHVLSLEQLQFNRLKDIDAAKQAEADRIARELENSTLNKFIRNLESRIYATISKQLVDNMFAECTADSCPVSGSTEFEGSTIQWERDIVTGDITLIVDGPDGYTEITIPGNGGFSF